MPIDLQFDDVPLSTRERVESAVKALVARNDGTSPEMDELFRSLPESEVAAACVYARCYCAYLDKINGGR